MRTDWMQTFTGKKYFPLNPNIDDICIVDIAHALATTNRFNGHGKFPYSVAQHSLAVSRKASPENALWGLLHDAAEAYLGDMIRPIKKSQGMGIYRLAEMINMENICKNFNLSMRFPFEIENIDDQMLLTEAIALGFDIGSWNLIRYQTPYPDVEITERPWRDVEREFLERFIELDARKGGA